MRFGPWLLLVCLFSIGCGDGHHRRPLKIVVPFAPGGESDTFARIMKKAIEDNHLYDGPIVIVNLGGAGGTIGSRYVKDAKPDGYTVLLLHDAILTAKYFGKVRYGAEAFEPVAGTGQSGLLVVVRPNSGYSALNDLLNEAKTEPDTIVFGVNMGAPTHFVGLQLEHLSPGSAFRFTQTGGGSSRFAALKGGHIAVTVFSVPEYLRFQPEEKPELKALAYLGEARHPELPEVPTAGEQGIDITSENMQMWWVPKGTPPARIAELETTIHKAMQTDYLQAVLTQQHTTPTFLKGEAIRERIAHRRTVIAEIPPPKPVNLPNFALMVGVVIAVLVITLGVSRLYLVPSESTAPSASVRWRMACLCMVEVMLYVLAMNVGWLSFRTATLAFVFVVGLTLTAFDTRRMPTIVVIALLMGFGIDWLFSSIFVVALP